MAFCIRKLNFVQTFCLPSTGQPMDLRQRRSTSEDPGRDRKNLVRVLQIVLCAEQPNIRYGQTASAFRKGNVVIEMKIFV